MFPVKRVAQMIRKHRDSVMNEVTSNVTNAGGESMNAKTKAFKRMACAYRNREDLRNAICFHPGASTATQNP